MLWGGATRLLRNMSKVSLATPPRSQLKGFASLSSAARDELKAENEKEKSEASEEASIAYNPKKTEIVKILRQLAKNLDAGRPSLLFTEQEGVVFPTPAVGYWRKVGYTTLFVEASPSSDGSQEIEVELKWSDAKDAKSEEKSNITLGQLTVFLRSLANILHNGAARELRLGSNGRTIEVKPTWRGLPGGAEGASVEYEIEDNGSHELEIKIRT